MRFLTADQVIRIHERVIKPNELQGMAHNKSIEAVPPVATSKSPTCGRVKIPHLG